MAFLILVSIGYDNLNTSFCEFGDEVSPKKASAAEDSCDVTALSMAAG